MEIFRRGHIEIEGAGNGKINHDAVLKSRSYDAGMSPEHVFQGLAPAFGFAKKIAQMSLIVRRILPSRYFKLDLTAQRDRMHGFVRHGVGDAELEQQRRSHREALRLRLFDLEA